MLSLTYLTWICERPLHLVRSERDDGRAELITFCRECRPTCERRKKVDSYVRNRPGTI